MKRIITLAIIILLGFTMCAQTNDITQQTRFFNYPDSDKELVSVEIINKLQDTISVDNYQRVIKQLLGYMSTDATEKGIEIYKPVKVVLLQKYSGAPMVVGIIIERTTHYTYNFEEKTHTKQYVLSFTVNADYNLKEL